ncbi:MAG: thioesterase family protein [Burkholderiales bacterium]|nr:thioesterase family protein [Burkholderiales bacterium]
MARSLGMSTTSASSAYTIGAEQGFHATELTRGPWDPSHQHAGPPTALVCRAIEHAAAAHGLAHLARLTGNLLRPVPLGEVRVEVHADYVGRNAAHYSARLLDQGKELARFTALVQREVEDPLPPGTPGHPLPMAPRPPQSSEAVTMPFAGARASYADLVENRIASGRFFAGPACVWFRLRHPLVAGETPSPYQRVAVAADSGNGISAALDFATHSFVNCDLTINLLRRPRGEWVCLDARTALGGNGCGLAQSVLYDEAGLIGHATQSLAVRSRR